MAFDNLQWLIRQKTKPNDMYLIYMYKGDLALNNQKWLICHKAKPKLTMYPDQISIVSQRAAILFFHIYIFFRSLSLSLSLHTHIYIYIYIYIYINQLIGLVGRVFTNCPGNWGSIPGRVIPKTQKMVLDATLLSTQHYKVQIKGKVEQSRERISTLPNTSV